MRMPYASAGLPRQDFVLPRNDKCQNISFISFVKSFQVT